MTNDELRAMFEAWISLPPFEHSCVRNGESSAWPGAYRLYATEIAWEAWQACHAALLERQARVIPVAWLRDAGNAEAEHHVITDGIRDLWIKAGNAKQVERYTIPLFTHSQAQASAMPDGWVLVPREATTEMLSAVKGSVCNVRIAEDDCAEYPISEDELAEIYKNMVSAATQPAKVQPIDLQAVREVIDELLSQPFIDRSHEWRAEIANKLSRAIG